MKTLSVTQLHKEVQRLFEDNFSMPVCIEGEITSFRGSNSSGHYYFAIKDDSSSISCVLFKGRSYSSTILPGMGKKVKLIGTLETYTNPSSPSKYQIIVSDIQDVGIGELYQKYLELMKKLGEEGLFDDSIKNSEFNKFPKVIGVVTAETGAVIHDIIETCKIRFPLTKILLYPTKVQGEEAVKEIINGLKYMELRDDVDTVIVGRGGGSFEDLFCYNNEELVRYIYSMKKQVISSVGHDQDRPLCDFVADMRASTPTQAAMLATPVSIEDIESNLDYYLKESKELYQRFLNEKNQDIDYYIESINKIFGNSISHSKLALDSIEKQIRLLSYNSVLDRGFSITTKENGEIIKSSSDVSSGDQIQTVIKAGKITSIVK
jgi:exodeoxyribonuclease VII large subunit